ncbi:hypothetical protein ACFOY2_06690 [Nonomuraea purpurea]|uniref:DUF3592 domain-containing protein n=1 Tax=Nonomuraea purpurea TaxID=1849276 RepID=A0ABV8G3V1_9ACTN
MKSVLWRLGPVVLAIAAAFGWAYLNAYGPKGWVSVVLWIIGCVVTLALIAVAFFSCTRALLSLALAVALVFCLNMAHEAVAEQALAEHGKVSDCLVRQEIPRQRTVTETHHLPGTSPGDPGSTWTSTRTETSYEYRLACPQARPDSMTTDTSVAKAGAVIAVSWDPTGRISPRPAKAGAPAEGFLAAGLVGGAAMLLTLLDAVLDAAGFTARRSCRQAVSRLRERLRRRR